MSETLVPTFRPYLETLSKSFSLLYYFRQGTVDSNAVTAATGEVQRTVTLHCP